MKGKSWTPQENAKLLAIGKKKVGRHFKTMSTVLGRTKASCSTQYYNLLKSTSTQPEAKVIKLKPVQSLRTINIENPKAIRISGNTVSIDI